MMENTLKTINISSIRLGPRLRPISHDHVAALAESIDVNGLQSPPVCREVDGADGPEYELISGAHRIAALKLLQHKTVLVVITEADDDRVARLLEIDENLIRHELNPLDRAVFLAERKDLYEELFPETRAQVAAGKGRQRQVSAEKSATNIMFAADLDEKSKALAETVPCFAVSTSRMLGLTEKSIRRAVAIAKNLTDDAKTAVAQLEKTPAEGELFALSQLKPEQQEFCVAAIRRTEEPAKTLKEALAEQDGPKADLPAKEKQLRKLMDAWNRAGKPARRAFQEWVKQEKKECESGQRKPLRHVRGAELRPLKGQYRSTVRPLPTITAKLTPRSGPKSINSSLLWKNSNVKLTAAWNTGGKVRNDRHSD